MIDKPRPPHSQPLRRPGWGLIQDVRPVHRTPHESAKVLSVTPLQQEPLTHTQQSTTARVKKPARKQLLPWLRKYVLVIAAPLVIIASVRLSNLLVIGEVIIGIYALIALIRRAPSRVSFWLASMVLVSIGIEFLLLPGIERANNSALFVFSLLCVGLVSLILETRRISGSQ